MRKPLASRHNRSGRLLQGLRGDFEGQKKSRRSEQIIRRKCDAAPMLR